jgi:hypothetical protein
MHEKLYTLSPAQLTLARADPRSVLLFAGGLYLRTSPQTDSGDWFVLSGNLSIAEMHSIAYDWKVLPQSFACL